MRRALELEPGNPDAAVPLARMLAARGEREEALELLSNVAGSFAADGLAARLRLEAQPELKDAFAALDQGELERGLDSLIGAIPSTDDPDRRDDLRRSVVGAFAAGAITRLAKPGFQEGRSRCASTRTQGARPRQRLRAC